MDLTSWRDEFPVLERKTYLISASLGPVSRRSRTYLEEYLARWRPHLNPDHNFGASSLFKNVLVTSPSW